MAPAAYVIKVFGGVRATARALHKSPSTIMGWKTPRIRGGTGGKIPGKNHMMIMRLAKLKKLDITAHDILFGRRIKK